MVDPPRAEEGLCVRCLMEQGALSVGLALTIGAAVGVLETFGEQQAVLRAVSAFRCFRRSPTPTPRRRKKQGRPSVVHNGLTGKARTLFRRSVKTLRRRVTAQEKRTASYVEISKS